MTKVICILSFAVTIAFFNGCSAFRSLRDGSFSGASINLEKACVDPNLANQPVYVGLRRLSRTEINNSIRDLFGVEYRLGDMLPADSTVSSFDNNASVLNVSYVFLNRVIDESEPLVEMAFQSDVSRNQILICQSQTNACAQQILSAFTRKAFHRKVTTSDITNLMSIYQNRKTAGDSHEDALKVAIRAILSSTDFLYRYVDGKGLSPDGQRGVDDHELASRLSFFIWGSVPDDELLTLADQGQLKKPDILKAQTLRLLRSSKADNLIESFAVRWLHLDNLDNRTTDTAEQPNFTADIKSDMITETKLFVREVMLNDKSPLDLVGANYSILNSRLAEYYGVPGITDENFQKTDISMTNRRGLLGHGSILTLTSGLTDTSVVKRGHLISERFLCSSPPPPPDDLDTSIPGELVTARQRMEARLANPSCVGCHQNMDPLGFVLEGFDPVGVWRTQMPDGSPVDSLAKFPDGRTYFEPKQLTTDLSQGYAFRRCFTEHLMNYAIGKLLAGAERCAPRTIGESVITPSSKFSDLIFAIVASPQFLNEGATK